MPLLCLPGLTRNAKDFHRLAQRLAGRHRVIAPDYRGRGRSAYDPNPENYQPTTYLNDIRHLLAVAGIHRSEEHTSELQSLMRISYAVFCLKKKKENKHHYTLYNSITT